MTASPPTTPTAPTGAETTAPAGAATGAAPATGASSNPAGWRQRPRLDQTAAFRLLAELAPRYRPVSAASPFDSRVERFDLCSAFEIDPQRFMRFSFDVGWCAANPATGQERAGGLCVDLSKQLWDEPVRHALLALAAERRVLEHRDAMFAGEAVNVSEGRAALHTALRAPRGAPDAPFNAQVHEVLDRVLDFAERVRGGQRRSSRDQPLRRAINIGIGGSHLGPALVVQALVDPWPERDSNGLGRYREPLEIRFASEAGSLMTPAVMGGAKQDSTLFVVSSKSGRTRETQINAGGALTLWFDQWGMADPASMRINKVFVSAAPPPPLTNPSGERFDCEWFPLPEWVGGRFSLWSAVGLIVALAIGADGFRQLLAGAYAMDQHFRHAPPAQNLPLQMALLDVWNRNLLGMGSRCVVPYSRGLELLPQYLQQLEMESNGKRVDLDGRPLPYPTAPVVWGGRGSGAQHAFFQQLHQGPEVVPVEFVAARAGGPSVSPHYRDYFQLDNMLAQARALMVGSDGGGDPARACPGNRPSTVIMLDQLDAYHLGLLLALYEHRTFCAGSLWGVNSFDQWGVELGKRVAEDISSHRRSEGPAFDPSTEGLLAWIRRDIQW